VVTKAGEQFAEFYKATILPSALIDLPIQICVVTDELDEMVRHYADRLGIGPWWVKDHQPPELQRMKLRGRPVEFSMRVALAWTSGFNWEIIQPLSGENVYREFLDIRGEGIQHVAVRPRGRTFEESYSDFRSRGFEPLQECEWRGVRVAYFQTEKLLGTAIELLDLPEGYVLPQPDYWYPDPSGTGVRDPCVFRSGSHSRSS